MTSEARRDGFKYRMAKHRMRGLYDLSCATVVYPVEVLSTLAGLGLLPKDSKPSPHQVGEAMARYMVATMGLDVADFDNRLRESRIPKRA